MYRIVSGLVLCLCLFTGLFLCGCALGVYAPLEPSPAPSAFVDTSTANDVPTSSAAPTASVAPTAYHMPLDPSQICLEGEESFAKAMSLDFSGYDYDTSGMFDMPSLIEKAGTYAAMCDALDSAIDAAANAAFSHIASIWENAKAMELERGSMDWRLMAALGETAEPLEQKLARLCRVRVTLGAQGMVYMAVSLPSFDELYENEPVEIRYGAMTLYTYLNTAYDQSAQLTDYDGAYELPEGYIDTIIDPLPKRNIKDGWFNDRSQGTRRHTGTDIRATTGSDIPSCTSGSVVRIGYNDIAGNYVTVLDDFGFYYVYCHMVELTTFLAEGDRVNAGDVIGHVGNTGNSDAPHLHLSIIAPEYKYINPYPVLRLVRYGR